jgi:hypothetical protein
MRASELRIGNYVESIGIAYSVISIDIHGNIKGFESGTSFNLDKTSNPIQITEEWLIKFGFKWAGLVSKGRYLTLFTPCGKAFVFKEGYIIFTGVTIETPIKYVHQLQNLYFALTGEELTINN